VAQDQRVEFLFAAQVSGQEQLQKLISSVDSLRKETEQLKSANAGLASSTDAVVRNGVRYNSALDAQSKALRQARQGTQQLGMQINDFATSVSTGASPIQAFNQQIGQVGFAMSQMGGIAGTVGGFLAGPFGAAVVIGTMVLAPFIESLFDTGAAAEEAKKKAENLSKIESAFRQSTLKLMESRLALQGPIEKNVEGYRKLYLASLNAAKADLASARTAVLAAQQRIRAAQVEAATIEKLKSGSREGKTGVGKSGLAGIIGSVVGFGLDLFGYGKGTKAAEEEKMVADTAANIAEAGVNAAQKILDDFEADAARGFKKPLTEAQQRAAGRRAAAAARKIAKEAEAELNQANQIAEKIRDLALVYGATGKEVGTTAKKLDDFNDMVKKLGTLNGGPAILKELGDSIELVRKGIEEEGAKKALSDLNEEMDKLLQKDLSPFEQRISSLMEKLSAAGGLDKLDPANKGKLEASVTAAANVGFDAALEAQRDLLNNALGVDDAFQMQVASLEQFIESMVALGIPTDTVVSKLKEFKALNEDTKIAQRNKELQDSFEAIGMAVSNSFKGMITGAMSFSNAMKGIISSVIDELIRLYVVQQIVGVVKSALGGIGLPAPTVPGKAIGGSVGKNKPYMVGEQGPELFIPGGSGTIIPNRNLSNSGGGNFNISVDARGASDPAAVRAQVQQGIMEAAPAIIAAAESRTVAGLRRPRLGGVMQ
jgi:hypothetical protein